MTIPTILELSKVPSEARVIGLPGGRQVTVKTFVDSWRRLKALPPRTQVANWTWYPMGAGEILDRIWRGVEDRINIRGGLRMDWRDNSTRNQFNIERTVKCECRWCGSPLPRYQPQHARFCDDSCRRNYST